MILRILFLLSLSCSLANGESQKPNVLFIVIDDMNDGISLLDPKSPIKTPNLERLAKQPTQSQTSADKPTWIPFFSGSAIAVRYAAAHASFYPVFYCRPFLCRPAWPSGGYEARKATSYF